MNRKIPIAFLMALIAISLFIPYASATNFGNSNIGSEVDFSADYKLAENITLTDTYVISTVSFYSSGSGFAQCGVYSSNAANPDQLLGTTEVQAISTEQWYNFTLTTPLTLNAGYYFIAVCANGSIHWFNLGGSGYPSVYNTDTLSDGLSDPFGTPTSLGEEFSLYVTGSLYVAPTATPAPEATAIPQDMATSTIMATIILVILVLTNIVFLGVVNSAMVRFLFALLTLMIGIASLTMQNVTFSPYLQMVTVVMSLLCMVLAAKAKG